MDEVLEIELEALRATFANDVHIERAATAEGTVINLWIAPRGVETYEAFVGGKLVLRVPPGYPDVSPDIDVVDTKGIGDVRLQQLHDCLRKEASKLAGEMVLGALCEHALDWMTEHNQPEGLCAFCLCAMQPQRPALTVHGGSRAGSGSGSQEWAPSAAGEAAQEGSAEQQLVRLPCYHAFHRGCYAAWWSWRQRALEAQERELVRHTGASAASVLREQGLPPREDDGSYATSCPVCRAPAPLADLAPRLRAQLAAARRASTAAESAPAATATGAGSGSRARQARQPPPQSRSCDLGYEVPEPTPEPQQRQRAAAADVEEAGAEAEAEHSRRLSPEQLAAYREVQARHAAVLERQRAAGGLIEATCYSIAGWTLGQGPESAPVPRAQEQAAQGQAPAGPPGPGQGPAAAGQEGGGAGRGRGPGQRRRRPGSAACADADAGVDADGKPGALRGAGQVDGHGRGLRGHERGRPQGDRGGRDGGSSGGGGQRRQAAATQVPEQDSTAERARAAGREANGALHGASRGRHPGEGQAGAARVDGAAAAPATLATAAAVAGKSRPDAASVAAPGHRQGRGGRGARGGGSGPPGAGVLSQPNQVPALSAQPAAPTTSRASAGPAGEVAAGTSRVTVAHSSDAGRAERRQRAPVGHSGDSETAPPGPRSDSRSDGAGAAGRERHARGGGQPRRRQGESRAGGGGSGGGTGRGPEASSDGARAHHTGVGAGAAALAAVT